jgi:uncharacterized protein
MFPVIDVHCHLFPDRLQAAVRRALHDMYGWEFTIPSDPKAFADIARSHGTDRFVVLPYAHKPGMADDLNAWTVEICAELGMAIPFACVHPDDDVLSVLNAARARGSKGLKLHHQVQQVAPDDPRLEPVYTWLQEHDLPLMAHAGRGPTDNGLVGPARVRRVLERHPELRICVPHLGMPDASDFLALAAEFKNLRLDLSGIAGHIPPAYELRPILGQILYGTDAPNVPWGYGTAAAEIHALGLSDDEASLVFARNAQVWLGD